MNRQKIRIAQIEGFVIYKKCRKEEFTIIDGIGLTDAEAIQKLKDNFQEQRQQWKNARFDLEAIVYDGVRMIYDTYSSIERPLMPNASDNILAFDFVA